MHQIIVNTLHALIGSAINAHKGSVQTFEFSSFLKVFHEFEIFHSIVNISLVPIIQNC